LATDHPNVSGTPGRSARLRRYRRQQSRGVRMRCGAPEQVVLRLRLPYEFRPWHICPPLVTTRTIRGEHVKSGRSRLAARFCFAAGLVRTGALFPHSQLAEASPRGPFRDLARRPMAERVETLRRENGPFWGHITVLHLLTDFGLAWKRTSMSSGHSASSASCKTISSLAMCRLSSRLLHSTRRPGALPPSCMGSRPQGTCATSTRS
jgi:hypothetical protein